MLARIVRAFVILAFILILGTVGYTAIEGWSTLDSLYMTVITIATVGFAEIAPLSAGGKLFTIVLIFLGVAGLAYSVGAIIDFMVEGHLRGLLEGRRMNRRISELKDHYIVVGIGRVGSVVARTLASEGVEFLVLDVCEECKTMAEEAGWLYIQGDATDEDVLRQAGVMRAKGLVTALDTDADNLFVSLSARTLNPALFIVARTSQVASEAKLLRSGADRVLTPNVIGGRRMASMVLHPVVSDYLDVVTHGDQVEYTLESMKVDHGSVLAGRSIRDAKIRDETGAYILAVDGVEGGMNTNPSPDTILAPGDQLVVLGTQAQLDKLTKLL
ncbi:MAG: potassium channel protein [Coriobacteriia bacterium]|nr:potassium channel protein [Coriobacteriia bacterium]MBN2821817.1 potassium channel protein [Coriobacteriia bacterium]